MVVSSPQGRLPPSPHPESRPPSKLSSLPRARPNMSDPQEQPWSNDPNAPAIPYYIYRFEKTWFAGVLISSVLYGTLQRPLPIHPSIRAHCSFIWFITGVLVVLFFGCMTTLFNPIHRRTGRIKCISKTAINLFFRLFLPARNACFLIQ